MDTSMNPSPIRKVVLGIALVGAIARGASAQEPFDDSAPIPEPYPHCQVVVSVIEPPEGEPNDPQVVWFRAEYDREACGTPAQPPRWFIARDQPLGFINGYQFEHSARVCGTLPNGQGPQWCSFVASAYGYPGYYQVWAQAPLSHYISRPVTVQLRFIP
jgi:hypothetical protein